MLKKEVMVQYKAIFQNFQGRAKKIHEKSQINVAKLGVEIRRGKPRNTGKPAFKLSGHIFTGG
jgi:hypothetical protein